MDLKSFDLIQNLFKDPTIEDIVLAPNGVSFFSNGRWQSAKEIQIDRSTLHKISLDIAEQTHQQLSITQPTVDSVFDAGDERLFRAHIAIEPLVEDGPQITLRRLPGKRSFEIDPFLADPTQGEAIVEALRMKKNILISGATGSGKTTFISALLSKLPSSERVLILEDSPELPVPNDLSVKLLCRSDRFGYRSGSSWELNDLVIESLRMRPDRIVVGECRSHEAKGLLQAMNTGHTGCLTSIHSGNCDQALRRFAELSGEQSHGCLPQWELVVQLHCDDHGKRQIQEMKTLWKS
ncbi:CpaF family protein [bacterium]|nr:CpaF family protein [bacterium]